VFTDFSGGAKQRRKSASAMHVIIKVARNATKFGPDLGLNAFREKWGPPLKNKPKPMNTIRTTPDLP
jgi:hypothetical protein